MRRRAGVSAGRAAPYGPAISTVSMPGSPASEKIVSNLTERGSSGRLSDCAGDASAKATVTSRTPALTARRKLKPSSAVML